MLKISGSKSMLFWIAGIAFLISILWISVVKVSFAALFIAVALIFFPIPKSAKACSRVFWPAERLVARTMDLPYFDRPQIYMLPRDITNDQYSEYSWESRYASIVVKEVGTPDIISEGINECGLSAHLLCLEAAKYPSDKYQKPTLHFGLWVQALLDQAATVEEAIALHKNFRIIAKYTTWPILGEVLQEYCKFHLGIEDAYGHCAVIEYVNGTFEPNIYLGCKAEVMTNDPVLDEQLKNYPRFYPFSSGTIPGGSSSIARFIRLASFKELLTKAPNNCCRLQTIKTIITPVITPGPVDDLAAAIANVHFDTYPTIWRTITDLKNLRFYFISDCNHKDKNGKGIYNILEIDFNAYLPVHNIKTWPDPYKNAMHDA